MVVLKMATINEIQSHILAKSYNFVPSLRITGSPEISTDPGKYEPDHNENAETRCFVLAHWNGKTNILVKFNTTELEY